MNGCFVMEKILPPRFEPLIQRPCELLGQAVGYPTGRVFLTWAYTMTCYEWCFGCTIEAADEGLSNTSTQGVWLTE